ncbi:uncharacterized protein LOC128157459 isoform X2 [Crassostrea angulata]|uniref:uncharacterized protein LOC128157459 isoform X2 n=1 Tax=Magallana angulata TaxID=2784310 RepID=UPI0022B0C25C|nr:uncharacterized protein LOC128157459 isoform X2 [Crassostrea angulata]
MEGMDLLILTLLGWIYQTTAESEVCVSIDASTNFIKTGEAFSIDCNIFGLSGVDLLTLNVEILLRQNQFIKRIVKGSISNFENNDLPENDNYSRMVYFYYKDDDYNKRTIVRLHVSNASNLDEGLYICYATLSDKNITKYNSKRLYTSNSSRAGNLTEYVIMPKPNASSPTLTPFDCSVFENDSIAHQIRLRPNESAFYSVLPTFSVNNNIIVISKPWVSYKGCYNYTVNKFKEEDCTTIDVTEWTKTIDRLPLIGVTRLNKCILLDQSENATGKRVSYEYCREDKKDSYEYIELYSIIDGSYSLSFIGEESSTCNAAYIDIEENKFWGIPCSETARCDAFCLRHDGSNVTEHDNKQWKDAMDFCISLNKSLPGIESDLLKSPLSHIVNNSLICLAVYQNLSIMFRPVIKQIKNIDGNTTVQPTNNTRGLPFLCRVKTDSSRAGNLTEYVIMPKPNASSPTLTPFDCSVFEDDSIAHQIRLRPNESAFYSVLPTFSVNNKSIVISKPWVSYKGCYNYTVKNFKDEDCTTIDVTEWTNTIDRLPLIGVTRLNRCILLDQSENATGKQVSYEYCREDKKDSYEYIELYSIIDGSYSLSFTGEESSTCNASYIDIEKNKLWGIPCSEIARCDAFCLRHDGSNVTEHDNKQWKDAMDLCISLNKSLPGIESDLLKSPLSHIVNNSLICLAVYQNLSIMFRPVIKQIKNIDGNTTVQPTNNTRGLPFLCRVKTDYEKPVPCINTSQTVSNVFTPTIGQNTGVPPTRQSDSKLIVIIAPSSVGFLLIVVVVSCVIHRVKRNRKNQGIRNTGLTSKEYIYSQPVNIQEAVIENIQREPINNIEQLEEDYSKLHSADKIKFNNTLEDEYAMTDQSSEYDVLRNTRENQEVSVDANIYDRTNNSVSGIYDTTLQTPDNDTYNL